ncbi:MAG: cytochrome b N-terminal domain-containing protein [Acidobacteria bacterium]|nr:cytochrome b N-terminal domain-containing protein [Acidobacteriota bacterium]
MPVNDNTPTPRRGGDDNVNHSRRRILLLIPATVFSALTATLAAAAFRFLRPAALAAHGVGDDAAWTPVAPVANLTGAQPLMLKVSVEHRAGWSVARRDHVVYVLPRSRAIALARLRRRPRSTVSARPTGSAAGTNTGARMSGRADTQRTGATHKGWLSRWTTLGHVASGLLDAPSSGLNAWARTTAGVVAFLLTLQLATGALLAFYYVPSAESAHTTVAYAEKVLDGGSWIRALHFHGSQWLPLALLLHLTQMLWRRTYRRRPVGWLAAILLLALVLSNGATGYSLPWDARAFYSTSVAAGIAGGLPLIGASARGWLTGGAEVSTLTLSRFYALHVLIVPALILAIIVARIFVLRESGATPTTETDESVTRLWLYAQLTRHALVIGIVFAALSLYAAKFPAPLGPPADFAETGYLPRPGAQFLWLFQLLKFFPATLASLVAFLLPGLILCALAALPFFRARDAQARSARRPRMFGLAIIALTLTLVASLSAIAYRADTQDPRVRDQLARQAQQESEFRAAPFEPRQSGGDARKTIESPAATDSNNASPRAGNSSAPPPPAFTQNCAKCHGQHGEGRSINPQLRGVSTHPHRTLDDLVAIMNNPRSYGLEARMPSFANKLSNGDKRAIAEWLVTLK